MESAKDFGFNEGYLLEAGTTPPADHTTIGNVSDTQRLTIPNQVLSDEFINYNKSMGGVGPINQDRFAKSYASTKTILNSTGITKSPSPQDIAVGVDFKGDKVYSNPKLANNKNVATGKDMSQSAGIALGAMGAFSDYNEATRFLQLGEHAGDESFIDTLDKHKTNGDIKSFVNQIAKPIGGVDKATTGFTGYKLFENWNSLSPAQKSLSVAGLGMQGFTFKDGQTFETKSITPEIPGTPKLMAAVGLDFASKGVNIAPATKKWSQLSALQSTFFSPKKGGDIVETSHTLGLLGYGEDGRSVPVDEKILADNKATPSPHYGVGAATIPKGVIPLKGYVVVGNLGDKNVIVPESSRDSVHLNTPDIASDNAYQIYNKWPDVKTAKQDRGVLGGSALAGGLYKMADTNPYSLGAVMTNASFGNIPRHADDGDLAHLSGMSGITLHRLVDGKADKATDIKGLSYKETGDFSEENYAKTMKALRGKYAENGISSKEAGYQLANQAYAEGRLDESQLVSAHKSLDMTFDDQGFTTAQKLITGKTKGFQIMESRRG